MHFFTSFLVVFSVMFQVTNASPGPTPNVSLQHKRAFSFPIPASRGSVTYSAAQTISGSFDGGFKTYGRGVSCTGQKEGGSKDAVFIIKSGGSLSNAIIGADQIEGVHCEGPCTITNVWWVDVCEDALTLKGDGNASVIGGGAANASDKIIQHNGVGTVTIDGFSASNFGKLYRSCGNCSKMGRRDVVVRNVKASGGKVITGINSNYGDIATITSTCATSVSVICEEYEGNNTGAEPKKLRSGPSNNCKYTSPVPAC